MLRQEVQKRAFRIGIRLETGISIQKVLNDGFVLLRLGGTGAVKQHSICTDSVGRRFNNLTLDAGKREKVLRAALPLDFRVLPDCPQPGTGRIDNDPVVTAG